MDLKGITSMTFEQKRKLKKFSQFQMAVSLGVTERTYRRWERGEARLPADILPKLQEVLGLSEVEVMDIIKNLQKEAS
jgi:transcriptional regulator with XRE-family HTH domain